MAFTKIVSPGIDTTGSYTVQDLNAVGVVTASAFSGPLTGNATGLTGTPDITVGAITAASADFSGNVSIGGTLTYEDVTNIDAVGVVTARAGIRVTGGSVGIGTDVPEDELHVLLSSSSDGPSLRLTNPNGGDGTYTGRISTGDAAGTFFAGINFLKHDSNDGEIRFRTKVNGSNQNTVTIVDGNVGIKTTTPNNTLTVGDTVQPSYAPTRAGNYIEIARTSGADAGLLINKNTGQWLVGINNGDGANAPLRFEYAAAGSSHPGLGAGTLGMIMQHDGDIGIGTDNPGQKLDIDGNIRLRAGNTTTYATTLKSNLNATHTSSLTSNVNNVTEFELIGSYADTGGSNPRVVLAAGGQKVGIGTNNPYAKNHIEIDVNAGAGSGSAGALWLKNANQTANNSATIFFGNNVSQAAGAINFIHKDYSTNAGDITFDTRTNGSTYAERLRIKSDGKVKFATGNSTTDYFEWGSNPRLFLQTATGTNGLRIYSDTTPFEIGGSASTRKVSMGGDPNYDLSISASYSLSSGEHDSSPKVFLNATRHNGSGTVTSFQTSIQAVSVSNTASDGYLGLGASATPDDLVIRPSGNIGAQNTNPEGKIHIGAALHASSDADNTNSSLIIKQSTNTREDGIYIERSGERKGYYMWMNPGGGSGDGLTFSRNNAGSYSNALILDRDANLWGGGTFYPLSDNSYDLGSSSNRWRNVYTTDLQLSNEGSQNDVDGTWGSYTIQEGEDELFLINRRNGKKYKFNLTEVN